MRALSARATNGSVETAAGAAVAADASFAGACDVGAAAAAGAALSAVADFARAFSVPLQAASSAIASMRMEMVIGVWADWVEVQLASDERLSRTAYW